MHAWYFTPVADQARLDRWSLALACAESPSASFQLRRDAIQACSCAACGGVGYHVSMLEVNSPDLRACSCGAEGEGSLPSQACRP